MKTIAAAIESQYGIVDSADTFCPATRIAMQGNLDVLKADIKKRYGLDIIDLYSIIRGATNLLDDCEADWKERNL